MINSKIVIKPIKLLFNDVWKFHQKAKNEWKNDIERHIKILENP